MSLDLAITNLAHGDGDGGGNNLGLAVREDGDNGGSDHAGSDGVLAVAAGSAALGGLLSGTARHGDNLDGVALRSPVTVVEVVEAARQALVEDGGRTQGERAIVASGETGSVDGTSLRRSVELELVVGDNGTSAVLLVLEDTIVKVEDEGVGATAVTLL